MGVVESSRRQADLSEVARATRPTARLTGILDGRQEEGHQDSDHGDHDEQFGNREGRPRALAARRVERDGFVARHDASNYVWLLFNAPSALGGGFSGGRQLDSR